MKRSIKKAVTALSFPLHLAAKAGTEAGASFGRSISKSMRAADKSTKFPSFKNLPSPSSVDWTARKTRKPYGGPQVRTK